MNTNRNLAQVALLMTVLLQVLVSGAQPVTRISGGAFHALFLKIDGSLWAMGDNFFGELGDGAYDSTNRPEEIVASNVTAVAAGDGFSLFLKSDGSLWAVGMEGWGALGDGMPQRIVACGVTAISAGYYHSLILKFDGSLWAMGDNQDGQLGDGTDNNTNLPEKIVDGPPGYNRISLQLLSGRNVILSYMGLAGTNYELDWSASLLPADWVPRLTNSAGADGVVAFTNTPDATTNSFWRVRALP